MSFEFTSGTYITRSAGNPSSTSAFGHTLWVKRTEDFTGGRYMSTIRNAGESTGHSLFVNDPETVPYGLKTQVNFGVSGQAFADDPLPLNVWTFVYLTGANGLWTAKIWDTDTGTYVAAVATQTAFAINLMRWGSDGYGNASITGRMAHLRSWDAPLSDAEATAERLSATYVKTANLVSVHSGEGGTISAALAGQVGSAYTNAGAIYSADTPTFATASSVTITGAAAMPDDSGLAPARYNRLLWSDAFANSVWTKSTGVLLGGAAPPPSGRGVSQRIHGASDTAVINQLMTNLPAVRSVASIAVRRADHDLFAFRHLDGVYGVGGQGIFNLSTARWDYTASGAGNINATFGQRDLGGGWYLIWIAATMSGNRIVEFKPVISTTSLATATGKSVDVAGPQYEDSSLNGGDLATHYKPSSGVVATRTLHTLSIQLSATTIGAGQTTTAVGRMQDNIGDPFDQYGPQSFGSSDTTKATVAVAPPLSDLSGYSRATLTGVANGTSSITFTAGGVTSEGAVITIGTAISRYVQVLVEPGWQGTSGFTAGVYQKHPTDPFPTTRLFHAINQTFDDTLFSGQSRLRIAVPTGVSVTAGQQVDVALRNDNYLGKAIAGPALFTGIVV